MAQVEAIAPLLDVNEVARRLGTEPRFVRRLIAERTTDLTQGDPKPETDVVLFGAEAPADLEPLPLLASRIRPNGAIWVVSRKGKAATLRYEEILDAAKAAGLVDNKVAAFSTTHTALRFVIPLALRPKSPPASERPR